MMKLRLFILGLILMCSTVGQAQTQSVGSCKIFPSNNPWNTRIDSLPVHPRSAQYIASVGGSIHLHPDFGSDPGYGIPWEAVPASQPFVPIDLSHGYMDESDPGPMPIPPNARVEGGGVGDAHVLIVDTGNHHLYELYQGVKSGSGWAATASAIFALDSNNYRPDGWTSCDAAGLPIFPGLVRMDECQAGEIKHAIRFTIQRSSKGFIFPARHDASSNTDTTNVMPMGMRLRLKATFDDSKYTGFAKVIITAMKRYGIIMADNGSNWYISGETNTNWPDNDIYSLKAITGNDFEVVYTGPIRVRPNQFPDPTFPLPNSSALQLPTSILDSVLAGSNNTVPVSMHNTGSSTITIGKYSLAPGAFQFADSSAHSIEAGGTATITLRFAPSAPGTTSSTLTIYSSDAGSPVSTVPLVGVATAGIFHIAANPFRFKNVEVFQTDSSNFSMTNSGNGPLSVTLTNPDANPDFSIVAIDPPQAPPLTVNPGEVVTATIAFSPQVVGSDTVNYDLNVTDYDGHNFDTIVVLIGEGVASSSVGITPVQPAGLTLYPNPAAASLTVAFSTAEGSGTVDVIDALGRNVRTSSLHYGKGTVDVSSLASGSYVVRIRTADGIVSKPLRILH